MNPSESPHRCSSCGAEMVASLPGSLCPKCLFAAGMPTQVLDQECGWEGSAEPAPMRGLPQLGEDFGPYRLIRLLGRGGMGVVFEADDLETGRRVALKVLSQALDSPEARKRFLREGVIAASINHPNSVYIFGTGEIAGTPVISMELVGGGTLKDKIAESGPMSPGDAVEAILEVIAGLEAGQKAGVLHRDVKPSNCFVDPDGTTKIGDFGLSISTSVRTDVNLSMTGSLFGTPAFSSPEQLRGDELTVRSDIYSVGVTLFYLLTGRLPFEEDNMVRFLVTVLERQPAFPESFRASLPAGLMRVVLKCLNKDPLLRYDGYESLLKALLPHSPSALVPAGIPLRLGAWVLDQAILAMISWPLVFGGIALFGIDKIPGNNLPGMLTGLVISLLYFGLQEGLRGKTLGKAVCGLHVARPDGKPPGLAEGFLRIAILAGLPSLVVPVFAIFHPAILSDNTENYWWIAATAVTIGVKLAIFSPCRRRNSYVAFHDLWSGTRVFQNSRQEARPTLPDTSGLPPFSAETRQVGPYEVLSAFGNSGDATLLLGYDTRLLRKVWLRLVPDGTPEVDPVTRHLARPARLRWLNGSRADGNSWDAYEAPDGTPLMELISKRHEWQSIRFWLLDLATELQAVEEDRSRVTLRLDHVWITADGHAKLLDFPGPGPSLSSVSPGSIDSWNFLRQVALSALLGKEIEPGDAGMDKQLEMPLPLEARDFLLQGSGGGRAREIRAQLEHLTRKIPVISRRRRLAMVGIPLAIPSAIILLITAVILMVTTKVFSEVDALEESVHGYQTLLEKTGPDADKDRERMEIYIAGRFGRMIGKPTFKESLLLKTGEGDKARSILADVARRRPKFDPLEFAAAKADVEGRFKEIIAAEERKESMKEYDDLILYPFVVYGVIMATVALPAMVTTLLFREGPMMRLLGIAVVGGKGRGSRVRSFIRCVLAWLPLAFLPIYFALLHDVVPPKWVAPLACLIPAAFAAISLSMKRGLEDRLAGTWLVPGGMMPDNSILQIFSTGRKNRP